MRDFEFLEPESVAEASRMLGELGDDCRAIAGGSALMLAMRQRMLTPTHLVSLAKIVRMRGIDFDPQQGLRIGALSLHADIARSALVQQHHPMLASMAAGVANTQVRNQGTLGGNLCYADPATDPPGCLMALGAEVVLASQRGERVLPMHEFLLDYYVTALEPDELLLEVRVPPLGPNTYGLYTRFMRTAAEHRPLVNVSLVVRHSGGVCNEARIVVAAATTIPTRATVAEQFLKGKTVSSNVLTATAHLVADHMEPISDQRGSADYRREMARLVSRRSLHRLFGLEEMGIHSV